MAMCSTWCCLRGARSAQMHLLPSAAVCPINLKVQGPMAMCSTGEPSCMRYCVLPRRLEVPGHIAHMMLQGKPGELD